MKTEINEMAAYDFGNLNYEGNVKDNCFGTCDCNDSAGQCDCNCDCDSDDCDCNDFCDNDE